MEINLCVHIETKMHGDLMNILFVCTGNVDRSKTAEEMFKNIKGVEAKSAGTSMVASVQLSKELIEWADRIFVMEYRHQKTVLELDPEASKKVVCLEIPDKYYFNQPELSILLRKRLQPYFKMHA